MIFLKLYGGFSLYAPPYILPKYLKIHVFINYAFFE